MSAEAALVPLLTGLVVGRIYPDVAPSGAGLPRIVYQQVGGRVINYTEGTLPDKENARMQIVCWASTRLAAINLMKQAEAAILAAPVIQAEAIGARISGFEQDTNLYSSQQDFSIWTTR
ncbi:DUF3168 domain-containing protein [Acidovorax radicis]|uniref:DUF3168 domain-containing protein n=1 Tax=Acidovorax radicis TaxID=758826 RepID=UPI001CFAC941|nr:DUF3168 domain-containing protein [Acidovorax radicis]UCV00296.1 DUF3168 domain-containing protein [Acidovorax radicis]